MKISYKVPEGINPKQNFAIWATWFGCGYLNPAPGTWGTLGAIPFGILFYALGGPILLFVAVCVIIPLGLWAAHNFGKASGDHDSKMIVIDEVAGMWIALIPAALNPFLIIVAFLAFRFFDILKPWPISFFDKKMENAAGVMLDDVVAGIFAALCVIGINILI